MKKVKFPLEMRDGVKVTTIQDLRESFNMEQVIGYFLDGKLLQWLESRYYEEEAEAVANLDKHDAELGKKLCVIFDVEYVEKEIDVEAVAERNERIIRLKQHTDDEKIIKLVDYVAFNQEELTDLYDAEVQKIYLCAGEFSIPESKQNLEYILVDNPTVKGLNKTDEPEDKESEKNNDHVEITHESKSFQVPKNLADKVKVYDYAITEDYVIYADWHCVTKINKTTGKEKILDVPQEFKPTLFFKRISIRAVRDNKVLLLTTDIMGMFWHQNRDVLLYDLNRDRNKIIRSCNKMSIYKEKIAYSKSNGDLVIYDADTSNSKILTNLNSNGIGKFLLYNNKLIYDKNGTLYLRDINGFYGKPIFKITDQVLDMMYYDNKVLMLCCEKNEIEKNIKLLSLDADNPVKPVKLFAFSNAKVHLSKNKAQQLPYIACVKEEDGYPIYVYNVDKKELRRVATGCGYGSSVVNRFQIVGDHLYYEKGENKTISYINLAL